MEASSSRDDHDGYYDQESDDYCQRQPPSPPQFLSLPLSSSHEGVGLYVSCTSSCSLRLLQIVANLKQSMQQQQEDGKEDENDCCTEDTSES